MTSAEVDSAATRPPREEAAASGAPHRARDQARARDGSLAPRGLVRRPSFVVGVCLLVGWVVVAVFWPWLAPADPMAQNPSLRLLGPSGGHLFGTDQFGRDVLSRVMAGARPVLEVAPLATALAVAAGSLLGLVCGMRRGLVDEIVMRVVDMFAVFPSLVAAVVVVALAGRSTTTLVLVIATFSTPMVTRSVRAAALVEREKPYVEAARLRGEPFWSLLWREVLPNVSGTVLVEATSGLGNAIFAASTLSFLGLGQAPGSPEWGASVADNRVFLQQCWWTVLFPALAVGSLVVGIALIADNLREQATRR
ncbi:dipeptide transporter; membrane component of ABC superfamily [Frankia canadensis]|uniref:Dipeptide transporter membrane component of ABC superfamily n=1 Tax=Frankia canadensis TaxID=1836972 RepID=A0A2I2KQ20_9ACTN|nr:ABC transporter permease [Frankia canadensis]SNQ47750.1 dipeptide transporter; membrane component of ABC superfamily [Frankia canadensis]SOU55040.1 dipeptide transporter; membrane component of ABC superfamily [Frankia canadensis]